MNYVQNTDAGSCNRCQDFIIRSLGRIDTLVWTSGRDCIWRWCSGSRWRHNINKVCNKRALSERPGRGDNVDADSDYLRKECVRIIFVCVRSLAWSQIIDNIAIMVLCRNVVLWFGIWDIRISRCDSQPARLQLSRARTQSRFRAINIHHNAFQLTS